MPLFRRQKVCQCGGRLAPPKHKTFTILWLDCKENQQQLTGLTVHQRVVVEHGIKACAKFGTTLESSIVTFQE